MMIGSKGEGRGGKERERKGRGRGEERGGGRESAPPFSFIWRVF